MKIVLLCVGKTDDKLILSAIDKYVKRLKHYINFEINIVPDIKNAKTLNQEQQKIKEGELLLKQMTNGDFVMLLDERGKAYSSMEFSGFVQQKMIMSTSRLVFVVGGPYGFSADLYKRADTQMSLSKMTFSHQMIRLFMVEQVYRAFSIMKGEPYHHE